MGKKTIIAFAVLAAIGVIEAAGAVATELMNNQPISIVRTIPDDLRWPVTLIENLMNQKVTDTFNNNAKNTKFGEANIAKMSPQEADEKGLSELKLKIDDTGTVIYTSLMPGIFPDQIPDTEIFSESRAKNGEGPVAEMKFIVPEGYQIILPKRTHYAIMKPETIEVNKTPNLTYNILGVPAKTAFRQIAS